MVFFSIVFLASSGKYYFGFIDLFIVSYDAANKQKQYKEPSRNEQIYY